MVRRMICCAVLAVLATSGTAFPQRFRHTHFVHHHYHPVVQVTPFYRWCPPWLGQSYSPLQYLYPYGAAANLTPDYTLPSPSYVFVGSAAVSYPQLIFNDGASYTVADYWREDDQLHFITVEEGGAKFVPHSVPFGDLDVERTKDRAAAEGFRFVMRDKPIEEWLEDRTEEQPARSKREKR